MSRVRWSVSEKQPFSPALESCMHAREKKKKEKTQTPSDRALCYISMMMSTAVTVTQETLTSATRQSPRVGGSVLRVLMLAHLNRILHSTLSAGLQKSLFSVFDVLTDA